MTTEELQQLPTPALQRRRRWHRSALWTVAIGAVLAIAATVYRFGATAEFPVQPLVMALLALAAATPVYLAERRMRRELTDRGELL